MYDGDLRIYVYNINKPLRLHTNQRTTRCVAMIESLE